MACISVWASAAPKSFSFSRQTFPLLRQMQSATSLGSCSICTRKLGENVFNKCKGRRYIYTSSKRLSPCSIIVRLAGEMRAFDDTHSPQEGAKQERVEFWTRIGKSLEVAPGSLGFKAMVPLTHLLCLFAPFCFSWDAVGLAFGLYIITGLGVTLSYHRNLSHKSYKLPKWLEYFFAYCGVHAFQSERPTNVADLENQFFYKFIHNTYIIHPIILATLLYVIGGFPYIVWGMGVRIAFVYHVTSFVNSACHQWGNRAWNTNDLSTNNWLIALLSFGEGWHNNHHAFEFSARHGLEWYQLDITWSIVWALQAVGLATDVKLPTNAQKRKMAFKNSSMEITDNMPSLK
ncbi:palmitoyl-monogalactosyldiacylglycerol delta-7 desaturase, chloroplastic-like isoform X2 [Ipomoea triloba]|uniref:palmitoyl-monogalactosyldiacylglycerol delta-7 desaturase, chloroplastic-like isoform X2 n=1 Tax=Ipomoea triloba TaxID=35885 RepID=UPI00125DCC16|nr:palmitoyl-monogalactosyldiacylglycerol delta-7 desaturase, chloroplastic-like isoform X2 [Ipomoea triloba]